ncbi:GumC family protein [Ovoidimarina sediminis]|uniref:GumC family protein n=1 Tax=Ovoidimarina sediminis TaxID=3079856 RepID=UPI002915AA06|nr:Wzz/FepE/Etk N-terminal domain-containing protein [Rhodophyticola sp. MJ-SS7]MDU8942574.1 Wzz/FepE/Etk N-terminal domain-containing protein [Rhodophyticola sp. MJ-SS7]
MNDDLKFYFAIFLRRFHYFALVAVVVSAAGIAVAFMLPTKYQAEAILLVEPPQIPDELAASTVRTIPQELLQIIEQRLMTRTNLLDIADEFDVYSDRPRMFADDIVEAMREDTTIRIRTGRNEASLFTIQFNAGRARTSADVVNAYVTRVLEDNAELRRDRAEGTMDFFAAEVERLSVDLARKSAEILDFKNANIDSLPENLNYLLDRQGDLRDRVSDIEREIASLGQQRERLIVVFNATGGTGGNDLRSPEQRELDALRNELDQALTIYSEQNPRVKQLRNRIASLETAVSSQGTPGDGGQGEARQSLLELQLSEIDTRVELLKDERANIENEVVELRQNIEKTPTNSVALEALLRDYGNLQQQYDLAVNAASRAATGERIELLSKGERISIISQPVAPREPTSPNRPMIALLSVLGGLAGGVAFVTLIELLNRSIRRPADLVKGLGITPLATLPLIRTPGEVARRRGLIFSTILFSTAATIAAAYYLHTAVIPLDLLMDRLLGAAGF